MRLSKKEGEMMSLSNIFSKHFSLKLCYILTSENKMTGIAEKQVKFFMFKSEKSREKLLKRLSYSYSFPQ